MSGLASPAPAPLSPLAALRELLDRKFPQAESRPSGVLPTGLADLDRETGGLRQGAVTELVGPSSAGALLIETTLHLLARQRCFGALVEAGNSFNPQDADPLALRRLLWVRCPSALLAVKAIDLLLRDGNLRVLLLDLQTAAPREVQRIPASTWHRFQRLVEGSDTALLILNGQPRVEAARVRIALPQRWPLASMRERRRQLLRQVSAQVYERRQFPLVWDTTPQSA